MARPSFTEREGEPAVNLHVYLRQSQYDRIGKIAHDTERSRAYVIRKAIDCYFGQLDQFKDVDLENLI